MNKDKQKDNAKSNPFVYQGPVPPNLFVGREKEIDTILSPLANPKSRGSSAISGERGTGKTSLLDYISIPAVYEEWGLSHHQCAFIKINCATITPFEQTAFWHEVLRLIEHDVQNSRLKRQIEELHTKEQISGRDMAELFDQTAEAGKLIVLLLDEFDWVVKNITPQEPFLNVMRAIISRPLQGLAVITATLEPLNALCRNIHFVASPFYNIFAYVQLKPFTRDEAGELIDRLLLGTGVRFTEDDRKFVYEASKGHPARLQKACYDLFEKLR